MIGKPRGLAELKLSATVIKPSRVGQGLSFHDRGFSERTIKALIDHGVDAPKRLLFAAEAELKKIPGIGKAAFGEIMGYRSRFIATQTAPLRGDELDGDGA